LKGVDLVMNYYLYFLLLLIIALTVLFKFKVNTIELSQGISQIEIISFVIFTVYIFGRSVNAIDALNYQTLFEHIGSRTFSADILFVYIIKLVKLFTEDYQVFRAIIGIVYLTPICVMIHREKKRINVPLFLLLCMLFPYFQSIVALRNTMSTAVCVLAIYLYFNSKKKTSAKLTTGILLMIATFIHDTNILYLVLFLLYLLVSKIKNKVSIFCLLLGIDIFLILIMRMGWVNSFLNLIVGRSNIQYIFAMKDARVGFLINVFFQIVFSYFLFLTVKAIQQDEMGNGVISDILILNYCAAIFIPLYSINVLFFRMYRGILIFNFWAWAYRYKYHKKDLLLVGIIVLEIICMLYDANGVGSLVSILGR